ncbi:MAG: hypothetical protein R2708_01395 [Vicinamibacterales bacterium]
MTRLCSPVLPMLALLSTFAAPAAAQGGSGFFGPATTSGSPTQVISTNPFGLAMDFFNAEYELRVSDSVTAGAGASRRTWIIFGESSDRPRLNGDLFVRYYPSGRAFNGIALGLKAGATRMPGEGTHPGVGFDLNHSYAFTDHAIVSTGIGMKRVLGRDRPFGGATTITTLRVNVGFGF